MANFTFVPVRGRPSETLKETIIQDAMTIQGNFPTFAQYKALGGNYSLQIICAQFGSYAQFFFELRFGTQPDFKNSEKFSKNQFFEEINGIFESDRRGFGAALLTNDQYGTILNFWGNWNLFSSEFMVWRANKAFKESEKCSGAKNATSCPIPELKMPKILTKTDLFELVKRKWELKGSQVVSNNFTPNELKKMREFSGSFENFMMEFCEWANS